jgi:uncharacterized membrane protein
MSLFIFSDISKQFSNNKRYIGIYLLFIIICNIIIIVSKNNYNFNYNYLLHFNYNYLLLFLIISFLGIFCLLYYKKEKNRIHRVAFVIIVCFGLINCFIIPLFCNYDESEHFLRSELTSKGELIPIYDNYTKTYATIKSIRELTPDNFSVYTPKTIFNIDIDTDQIDYFPASYHSVFAQNPFYGYLAPAFGIFLAKTLNLNVIWMLWLGRLFNLLLYAFLSAYAIRKSPIFKIPLIAMACLPLSLYLAASVSIDALINGLALVIIAYFFCLFKSLDKSIDLKQILIFLSLCLLIGLCKVPYFIFSILILIIPIKKFKHRKYFVFCFVGIIILGLLAILWSNGYAMPKYQESYRLGFSIERNVDLNRQLLFIKNNFIVSISNILEIYNNFPDFFSNFFGYNYKYFTPILNKILYSIFFIGILFLYPDKSFINLKSRVYGLLMVGIYLLGFRIIQFLNWTPVGQLHNIEGMNCRYFIPLLGFLPFVFGINNKIFKKINRNKIDIIKIDNFVIILIIGFISISPIITFLTYY